MMIALNDVSYRCIGGDFNEGVLACGFMKKLTGDKSQIDFNIGYYSGFFLMKGKGLYVTETGEEIPVNQGDYVQRFPGKLHSTYVEPDGEWLEFFVSFGKSVYETLSGLGLLPKQYVVQAPVSGKLAVCLEYLDRLKKTREEELPQMLLDMQKLLLQLLKEGRETAGKEDLNREDAADILIEKAAGMLSANLGEEMDLEALAESLHLGYETFRKEFRQKMGVSPARYRLGQKMRQACYMLDGGLSIKETALMSGYGDVYAFTRQFTKAVGMAPGQYRKRSDAGTGKDRKGR